MSSFFLAKRELRKVWPLAGIVRESCHVRFEAHRSTSNVLIGPSSVVCGAPKTSASFFRSGLRRKWRDVKQIRNRWYLMSKDLMMKYNHWCKWCKHFCLAKRELRKVWPLAGIVTESCHVRFEAHRSTSNVLIGPSSVVCGAPKTSASFFRSGLRRKWRDVKQIRNRWYLMSKDLMMKYNHWCKWCKHFCLAKRELRKVWPLAGIVRWFPEWLRNWPIWLDSTEHWEFVRVRWSLWLMKVGYLMILRILSSCFKLCQKWQRLKFWFKIVQLASWPIMSHHFLIDPKNPHQTYSWRGK